MSELQQVMKEVKVVQPEAEPAALDGSPEPTPAKQQEVDGYIALVASRSRVKAHACRWQRERTQLTASGATHRTEIVPRDRETIEEAKSLPNCFVWMSCPSAPVPNDLSLYETLAACFEALAAVLTIVVNSQQSIAERHLRQELLNLVAEAQSALREAVRRVGGPTDSDQIEAFFWVRDTASDAGLYVERYLREDDRADPSNWPDLLRRINHFGERIEQQLTEDRKRRRAIQKLRYQLEQAVIGNDDGLWHPVARTLDELVADGVPPSNLEIRELLLPHIDIIPLFENPPKGFELVLREVRRIKESLPDDPPEEDLIEIIPLREAVANMLRGRAVLLIGGDARAESKAALEQSFRLSELVWVPGKHHQSVSSFEPFVARPDVAVVLLAIRWASHSFTDLRHLCRKYDKPLVRLPGGYSPNQVATQILNQSSWQLSRQS